MSEAASRAAVEAAAAEWNNAVLVCRKENRHEWRPAIVTHDRFGYTIVERCARRCGCRRTYDMDPRGYISKPKILYPTEGYLLKGLGRVDADGRAALRLAWVATLTIVKEVTDE